MLSRPVTFLLGSAEDQFVSGDVHTNTVKSFFSLVKRGIYGTYHKVSRKHLHRYMTQFEFMYNNRKVDDGERIRRVVKGAEGNRFTHQEQLAG